jgi:hypothetical protein
MEGPMPWSIVCEIVQCGSPKDSSICDFDWVAMDNHSHQSNRNACQSLASSKGSSFSRFLVDTIVQGCDRVEFELPQMKNL